MSPASTEAPQQWPGAAPSSDRSSIAHNATWLTVALFTARACTFALAIFMGRDLGVSAYGRYGFAVALGTIIVPLADLGVTPYVSREVARDRLRGDARSIHLLAVKIRMSIAALAISAVAAALLSGEAGAAAAIVVVLASMLAEGVSAFVYGYFQGREQMRFEGSSTALAALARSLGGIACVLVFGELLAVLTWMLAVSTVQLAIALHRFTAVVDLSRVRRRAAAKVAIAWRRVVALGSTTVFALIYLQIDSVIIGVVYNAYEVGLYTAAYALTAGLQIIPWQIAVALAPVFARTHVRDPAGFRDTWHRGLRVVLSVSLPLSLISCLLAGDILRLFFGPSFGAASTALAILVWSSPIWASNMVVSGALRGARRDSWLAFTTGVGVIFNVGLNLWAIPAYGIDGAAAVTVGTELAVLIAQGWLAVSRGVAPIPRLPYVRLALALAALSAAAVALHHIEVLSVHNAGVIVVAFVALCAYAAALLATGAVSRDELRALRSTASSAR